MIYKQKSDLGTMANYGGPSFPGLASSTGTRVDSSSKDIMACKLNDTLMATWCCDQANARNTLHTNKMKYCVHKGLACDIDCF